MITLEPDTRCLRGLAERLVLHRSLPTEQLLSAARRILGPSCLETVEHWGERAVHRLIVQFRIEVRIGELDDVVTLHHRQLSPATTRLAFRESLVVALLALSRRQEAPEPKG